MVGGVERSFGTSVPFLIILYTKKIKNQGVLRKKSNTRSYFFEISQPSRICAVASPVFYFTFILYLFGEGVAPTKNAGSTLGTVQEKKSFPPSRRRGRSTVVFAWAILSTRSRRRACPPLPGRRCCSAAFSPGESKKRLPPLREPESGAALKRRNAAYPARAKKLSPAKAAVLYAKITRL